MTACTTPLSSNRTRRRLTLSAAFALAFGWALMAAPGTALADDERSDAARAIDQVINPQGDADRADRRDRRDDRYDRRYDRYDRRYDRRDRRYYDRRYDRRYDRDYYRRYGYRDFAWIRSSLRNRGFVEIRRVGFRRGVFVVEATDRRFRYRGSRVRMRVDARNGRVLQVRVIGGFYRGYRDRRGYRYIDRDRVRTIVFGRGYRDVVSITLVGDRYRVYCRDRRGRDLRIWVDAYSGRVISVDVIIRR